MWLEPELEPRLLPWTGIGMARVCFMVESGEPGEARMGVVPSVFFSLPHERPERLCHESHWNDCWNHLLLGGSTTRDDISKPAHASAAEGPPPSAARATVPKKGDA